MNEACDDCLLVMKISRIALAGGFSVRRR